MTWFSAITRAVLSSERVAFVSSRRRMTLASAFAGERAFRPVAIGAQEDFSCRV